MIGQKLTDISYSRTISQMMKKVGIKLKRMVTSKSSDKDFLMKLSDKLLGYLYNPEE